MESNSNLENGKLVSNLKITVPSLNKGNESGPGIAIICVLDISGSMDCEATQGQSKESDGFSRLDLVKHSANTIIQSLGANDMMGVITFSDVARIDLPLSKLDNGGKMNASKVIANMKT